MMMKLLDTAAYIETFGRAIIDIELEFTQLYGCLLFRSHLL